jgi:hypothetical protein
MSISRIGFIAIMFVALAVATTSIGDADTPQKDKRIAWANEPDVLLGLRAINLHIDIRGDSKNAESRQDWLRTKIEKRLRQAGLTVLTTDEAASETVPVMLSLIIDMAEIEGDVSEPSPDGCVYLVRLILDDIVVPYRDPQAAVLGATTWSRQRFGYARRDTVASRSMDDALALVDVFCFSYSRVNQITTRPQTSYPPDGS